MTAIPHAVLLAGDVHGDAEHLAYLYQVAVDTQCEAIFVVGDFGYWEHEPDGHAFLDVGAEGHNLTKDAGFPVDLFWIDGNHDNHALLWERYGPGGPKYKPTSEGFWEIRTGVYYVPRGHRWTWHGFSMMGLGGAYSWDKSMRLKAQRKDGHVRWFPTEELTDADVDHALEDRTRLDVLFTHDKPRDVDSPKRQPNRLALPNQDKVQKVVDALQPKLLVHGHLHARYTARVDRTVVEGLGCNPQINSEGVLVGDPRDSWLRLSLL